MIPQFRHKCSYGYTGTGKTTVAKERAGFYLRYKQPVFVFPGNGDTTWPRGVRYIWTPEELEDALRDPENYGAFIFLDEGANLYDEVTRKNHPIVNGLFMRGRHLGYTVWILTQYVTSIPRKVRVNCTERYLFATADEDDAKMIWGDCNRISVDGVPLWQAIMALQKFEYFRYVHPGQITRHVTRP